VGRYVAGGGNQRVPPMRTIAPSVPAKCVGVGLVLWLRQTISAVCDVRVKRVQFTMCVKVSASAAPFERRRRCHRVMVGVRVL